MGLRLLSAGTHEAPLHNPGAEGHTGWPGAERQWKPASSLSEEDSHFLLLWGQQALLRWE